MVDIIHWPTELLQPSSTTVVSVPFSRSGGRTLGGISRSRQTDRGFNRITLEGVTLFTPDMKRTWNAIATDLSGQSGLILVPAWSIDSAPYVEETDPHPLPIETEHSDGTEFSDGTEYSQGVISVEMASFAPLGSSVVTVRCINSRPPAGVRFSYRGALYKTGAILEELPSGIFRVSVTPSIRQSIPEGALLEFDRPTCLCHLSSDSGMILPSTQDEINSADVDFVEAVDYWNDLARGLIQDSTTPYSPPPKPWVLDSGVWDDDGYYLLNR